MSYAMSIAGGAAVKYKEVNFTKRHPNPDCDTFNAIIEWDEAVNLFDRVSITHTALPTILFEGLVESINCYWDNTERVKRISGRCRKVILWKKFIERFERGNIDGFFRHVSVSKLVRFLLRCPISDAPTASVFHRIGYGFDLSNGECSAIRRDPKTHPEWCRFRRSGFRWRLNGCRLLKDVDDYTQDTPNIPPPDGCVRQREWVHSDDIIGAEINTDLLVNGRSSPWVEDDWTQGGTSNIDPWLDICDDEVSYIHVSSSEINAGEKTQSYFTFADIGALYNAFDADRANCSLHIGARLYSGGDGFPNSIKLGLWLWAFWMNDCDCDASDPDDPCWVKVGTVTVTSHTYDYVNYWVNISTLFTHWGDYWSINHAKLKIVAEEVDCAGDCGGDCSDCGGVRVTCAWLRVNGDTFSWQNDNTPWLHDWDDDNWIEGRRNYRYDMYWEFESMTGCKDTLGHPTDVRPAPQTANLHLVGKNIIHAGAGVDSTVRVHVDIGGGYINVGDLTWDTTEVAWKTKTINLLTTFPNITHAQLSYLRMRLELRSSHSGVNVSYCRITYAYLEIEESDYQRLCDWFDIDLGAPKDRVMGVLIESRYSDDKFAVNYEIQTSDDKLDWTIRAGPVTDNSCKDILESWDPVDGIRYIRIHITAPADPEQGWEISQVFVWQAEEEAYDIDGITIGNITAPNGGNFHDYGCQVAPQSFGFQRMSEAINAICQTSHDGASIPWEWWIEHSATHDFCFKEHRGVDRTGGGAAPVIHIQKGVHIKSVDITRSIRGTVQRARVIGRGEGKNSDEIASDWQLYSGIGALFYEKVISEKSVGNKSQADVLADVYAEIYGDERLEIIVELSYDPWEGTATHHYEVGDEVLFSDATCDFEEEPLRIVAIERSITNEPSNTTTLTLATSWYDVADLWAEINRQLRNVGLTGTVVADWRGEGGDQNKQSAQSMEDIWSAQAKNDEIDPPSEKDDDRWHCPNDGVNWQGYACDEDVFYIKGSKVADEVMYFIRARLLKDEHNPNGWIDFDQSPRFVCEIMIPYDDGNPDTTDWRVGDTCYIRMMNTNRGFGFKIYRATASLEVYTYLIDVGGVAEEVYLGDLSLDTKYRLEARVDWEERLVKWYFNNTLTAIMAFDPFETGNNSNMYPFHIYLTTSNPAGGVIYWSHLYIYSYRAQALWES